ncbi:hypothetical protein [Desulfomicrobium baculatum]|uniref:hypothetical protein n=1 Tax=Desulfomicrobium baculatum TaxID=899 RepID=UPI00117F0789|nr:hypothetical protein [Desulfomicrobium baculatum]
MEKFIMIIIITLLVSSCSFQQKKEFIWINSSGNIASEDEIKNVKCECEYDKKIEYASKLIGISISAGRYQSNYGSTQPDAYVKEAAKIIQDANNCVREKGFTSREKTKP